MFVDLFTKWFEIIPIKNANGKKNESEFHKRIISRWGTPRVLHTENGTELVNKTIQELTEKFRIRHAKTPKYYPQTNRTEQYNRTIKQITKAYLENGHATWDDNFDDLQFAINTSKNALTQFTPAFLNLGRELLPFHSFRKSIEKDDDIEFQDVSRWTDRLRRLPMIKKRSKRIWIKQIKNRLLLIIFVEDQ